MSEDYSQYSDEEAVLTLNRQIGKQIIGLTYESPRRRE
jgi:hypothetical protein